MMAIGALGAAGPEQAEEARRLGSTVTHHAPIDGVAPVLVRFGVDSNTSIFGLIVRLEDPFVVENQGVEGVA